MSDIPDIIPEEVLQAANAAVQSLIPEKSKIRYQRDFEQFEKWCADKSVNSFSETVLLAFFGEKSKTVKSSTLWSLYSKIKSILAVNHAVDISKYYKLIAFLKKQNIGYRPKKSNTFLRSDIEKFVKEAPDDKFLLMKVKNNFLFLYLP